MKSKIVLVSLLWIMSLSLPRSLYPQLLFQPPAPRPGDLDPTFGSGQGYTVTGFNLGEYESEAVAHAVAIQRDGKIVVAGWSQGAGLTRRVDVIAVVRYHPSGVLDETFGNGGKVITQFPEIGEAVAFSVAVQKDGKIVVAGYHKGQSSILDVGGGPSLLDTMVQKGVDVGQQHVNQNGTRVELQEEAGKGEAIDGKLQISGFAVVRYCPNGKLDDGMNCGGEGFGGGRVLWSVARSVLQQRPPR